MRSTPLKQLILPMYLPSVIYAIGNGALTPVLVLAALAVGFDDATSSAVIGIGGFIGIMISPFLGGFIARVGDRRAMYIAMALSLIALNLFLLSLVSPPSQHIRAIFVVGIVLVALASNTWLLARQTYIAETTPIAWRSRALATLGGTFRFGELFGPLVATFMLAMWYLTSVVIFNIGAVLITLIMLFAFSLPRAQFDLDDIPDYAQPLHDAEANKTTSVAATAIMGVAINALFILRASRAVIIPLWGTYLGFDATFITAIFGMSALLDTTLFLVAGAVTDKWGRHWGLLPTLIVMSVGISVMILWREPAGYIAGAALIGIGNGFGTGINMTVGADLSPARNKAKFLGKWQAIANIGNAGGPFIISGMTALAGLPWALASIAGIGFLGTIWAVTLMGRAYAMIGMDVKGNPL